MKLTKSSIERLNAQNGKQVFYRDSALPGFALRITPAGTKSFIVEKRVNGKGRRVTIGQYGLITVEEARKKALTILADMAQGHDPAETRRQKQASKITLLECFNDYLLVRNNLTEATRQDYERATHRALKDWQHISLVNITRDKVLERHRALGEKSPARANNTMRVLRALFNFAMYHYETPNGTPILLVNPVKYLSDCRAWYRIKRRQTLLKLHQLPDWYQATLKLGNPTTRDYLHFLLFTGLRRSEAAQLAWENVDFADRSFTIPDTKNHCPHTLPLSDYLLELLETRYGTRENGFVFPGKTEKGYLLHPRTAIDRVVNMSGIHFTPHDLRRTFITVAESLDISAYALKRLLNHKMTNDITAGYIVSSVERLRRPMQDISDYLLDHIHVSANSRKTEAKCNTQVIYAHVPEVLQRENISSGKVLPGR